LLKATGSVKCIYTGGLPNPTAGVNFRGGCSKQTISVNSFPQVDYVNEPPLEIGFQRQFIIITASVLFLKFIISQQIFSASKLFLKIQLNPNMHASQAIIFA
jgi:hypothetical protein